MLMDLYLQDGDKFFRLPEVYVKGNNVCSNSQAKRMAD